MTQFAKDTNVSVSSSKQEIERIIERYGAQQFMSGWNTDQAMIAFTMQGRQIRFVLPMPAKDERRFTHHSRGMRTPESAIQKWEQACRQRWRALALVIKAKLEAVESGISVFEDEFMANIVLPNGKTVSDEVRPRIAIAYETREMPRLLPDYAGGANE
ncbi:MAG: hypothetical protein AAF494_00860 [Pseudomonadota bacterium]